MVPFASIMLPQLIMYRQIGAYNNYAALLLPFLYPFGFYVYLYKGFFDQIPGSYFEAASLDGASNFYLYTKICMPLSKAHHFPDRPADLHRELERFLLGLAGNGGSKALDAERSPVQYLQQQRNQAECADGACHRHHHTGNPAVNSLLQTAETECHGFRRKRIILTGCHTLEAGHCSK